MLPRLYSFYLLLLEYVWPFHSVPHVCTPYHTTSCVISFEIYIPTYSLLLCLTSSQNLHWVLNCDLLYFEVPEVLFSSLANLWCLIIEFPISCKYFQGYLVAFKCCRVFKIYLIISISKTCIGLFLLVLVYIALFSCALDYIWLWLLFDLEDYLGGFPKIWDN